MLKKTITYTAFDEKTYTEDFYFNMSTSELAELELVHEGTGGFHAMLHAVVEANDGRKIMDTFKEIIRLTVGERSEDGKRFTKSPAIAEAFMSSAAYDVFFMELLADPNGAAVFINAVVPKDLQSTAEELEARRRNHPSLQGFNKKKAPAKASTLSVVPGPVETVTEDEPDISGYDKPKDLSGLSLDELIAIKREQEKVERSATYGRHVTSDHDATPEEAAAILNPNGQWDGPVSKEPRTFVYTAAELTLWSADTSWFPRVRLLRTSMTANGGYPGSATGREARVILNDRRIGLNGAPSASQK